MEPKIFISYSRKDKEQVFALKDEIENRVGPGSCWIDLRGIESDKQFVDVIIKAIKDTIIFLFIYSANSRNSEWTRKELDFAKLKDKKLVFVNMDGTSLDDWFAFQFSGQDIIDLQDESQKKKLFRNLSEWCGTDDEQKIDAPEPDFGNELGFLEQIDVDDFIQAIKRNDVPAIKDKMDSIGIIVDNTNNEEAHFAYYLALAVFDSAECVEKHEQGTPTSYWRTFWSYLAYLKQNRGREAQQLLYSLQKIKDYPQDNMMLLATAGAFIQGDSKTALYFKNYGGESSPILEHFAQSVIWLINKEKALKEGFNEKDCAFYLENLFGQINTIARVTEGEKRKIKKEKKQCETVGLQNKIEPTDETVIVELEEETEIMDIPIPQTKTVKSITPPPYKQKARRETDINQTFEVEGIKFNLIKVEAGTFMMGNASGGYDDEKPIHQVTLTKDYYIGETQVTQALWKAVMGYNPSRFKGDNLPVDSVSWKDCQKFIKKLNSIIKKKFRLPTEAEWEFAARGGNQSNGYRFSGSDDIDEVAWYWTGRESMTHEVAMKKANEIGIYDMSGNVREWCNDWYDDYSRDAQINPSGPKRKRFRVLRGGCWMWGTEFCRPSIRICNNPDYSNSEIGLRLALSK